MSKAFRNPEQLQIVGRGLRFKMKSRPFTKVRRVAAQIDRNIPNVPREHTDQLSLGLTKLIVETTQHTLSRKRLVVLNEMSR